MILTTKMQKFKKKIKLRYIMGNMNTPCCSKYSLQYMFIFLLEPPHFNIF